MANSTSATAVRLGTRGSLLARLQSQLVAGELEKRHPGLRVELCIIKTSGDQITDRPLHDMGGKGLFTRELERALLEGKVDMAVHSFKDVPVTMPLVEQTNLIIGAAPVREDPRDVLVCTSAASIRELPKGARVGTGSLRRRSQLLAARSDLTVVGIRGNVDTRLRKVRDGEYQAVILAMAGLKRSGLFDATIMWPIAVDELLPSAAQGALALQCRRDDTRMRDLLAVLNDEGTALCVQLEREVVRRLEGDCHSPIAALASVKGPNVELQVAVGKRGGEVPVLRAAAKGDRKTPQAVVDRVMSILTEQHVQSHLHG